VNNVQVKKNSGVFFYGGTMRIEKLENFSWKNEWSLVGLHTAWVVFCGVDGCSNWQVLWVSETVQRPFMQDALACAYEIGWHHMNHNNITHWVCPFCFPAYCRAYRPRAEQPRITRRLRQFQNRDHSLSGGTESEDQSRPKNS